MIRIWKQSSLAASMLITRNDTEKWNVLCISDSLDSFMLLYFKVLRLKILNSIRVEKRTGWLSVKCLSSSSKDAGIQNNQAKANSYSANVHQLMNAGFQLT